MQFRIALIGDCSVGKTTFLIRHTTGDFREVYLPTKGSDRFFLSYMTNYGPIKFIVTEYSGRRELTNQEGRYKGNQAAIVMFDVESTISFENVNLWLKRVYKDLGKVPVVICANKCDLKYRKVRAVDIQYQGACVGDLSFEVSAKTNYHIEYPFLALAKGLTGYEDLIFKDWPEAKL